MLAEYVDHMGNDLAVVNAARVSFDKKSLEFSDSDEKLIKYLADHNHWTPFSHTAITLRMQAPVPVRTQCFKHKIGLSENEESRRYINTRPTLYVPESWRTKPEGSIKQGSGTESIPTQVFQSGFCMNCGNELIKIKGHKEKKYCCDSCKSKSSNKHRNPYKTVFNNAKARVKRDNQWEWSLEFDTFLFPEYCKYLGIKLDYSFGKGSIKDNSPSFDRIDSSKGYTIDNVEIISNKANTMKSNANRDELVKMAESILLMYKGVKPTYEQTYESVCNRAIDLYEAMIEDGVAPEQARFILPQGCEVNWIWTGNLYSFANFFNKRTDKHAQKEIQQLAHMVGTIIEPLFPVSWKALVNG